MTAAARHYKMSVNYLPVNKHHIRDELQGTLKCQLTIYQFTDDCKLHYTVISNFLMMQ